MNERFERALQRFDEMNALDPRESEVDGQKVPTQLLEATHLDRWVSIVAPGASEALRLAARCQHLMRFSFPRSDYPEGRNGYLKWRKDLMKKHADLAATVLADVGYDSDTIEQVRRINTKGELKLNADTQAMEDALCLSFLENDYSDFAQKYEDGKVIDIVQKTWGKMSERGRTLALGLPLSGRAKTLVERALS
jgi:hypothetical protein